MPIIRPLILILVLSLPQVNAVEVGFYGGDGYKNSAGLNDIYSLGNGISLFEEDTLRFYGCPYFQAFAPTMASERTVQGQGKASLEQTIYGSASLRSVSVTSTLESNGDIHSTSNGVSNPIGSSISQDVSSSSGELKAGLRAYRDGAYTEVMAYKKDGFMSASQRLDFACALMASQKVSMIDAEAGYAYARAEDCHGNTAGVKSWVDGGDLRADQLAQADCGWPCCRIEPLNSDLAVATQTSEISGENGGGGAYGTNGFADAKTWIKFSKGGIDLTSAVSSTDDGLEFANDLSGQADHMTQGVIANSQLDRVHYMAGFVVQGQFLTDIDISMMR